MAYTSAATTLLLCLMLTLTGLLSSAACASQAELLKQLEMMEQLDELDRKEFNRLLEQADLCSEQLDFSCARQHMREAAPLIFDPAMEQRFDASQSYYQEMQNYAADLIQETIDYRPLVQFRELCPDPFADYGNSEARGNDFHRVASRWIDRRTQHEEFVACKEAFDDGYDIDDWADSLAEMQALEKQLDHRSKAAVHELSRASEQRRIRSYIEDEEDTYQDVMRDYARQLSYLARRDAGHSSGSGDWMDALNTSLQAMNQQMQANNQQIRRNLDKLQQEAVRQARRRREENRAAIAARVREQQQRQKLLAERQHRLQRLRKQQKQTAANREPAMTYVRGEDQNRIISNSYGSVNLGGGAQNTQTGAVRFDYRRSGPDPQSSTGNSQASGSANSGNHPTAQVASSGHTAPTGTGTSGMPYATSGAPSATPATGSGNTKKPQIEQHVWKAYAADNQSDGLLSTRENTIYSNMTGTIRFLHTFYRKSYTDKCTIDYGTLWVVDWEYHGEKELRFSNYFPTPEDARRAWFDHKNSPGKEKSYSDRYEDIERVLRNDGCESVARGKWVHY